MTSLNSILRFTVALMGLVFFLGAFALGEFLWGLGILAFFGVAFTSLMFSGLDPSAQSPKAKQWFRGTLALGAFGGVLLLVAGVTQLVNGQTNDGTTLLGAGAGLFYVWHKQRHAIKVVITDHSGKR